jgi:cytochrome c oxidase subunit II
MDVERYEKAFLAVSAVLLVVFLGALFYAGAAMGIHLPTRAGEIRPDEVLKTPPFDRPGVHEVAPGRYEVVLLSRAWAFIPAEIRVPAGAEVRFRATSLDIVHGLSIDQTRVNLMLIPGQITEMTYRFRKPGEHLMICHEYCGLAHHRMSGKVIVE